MIARSCAGSSSTRRASNDRWPEPAAFESSTVMRSWPRTTWLFVTTYPPGWRSTPLPDPRVAPDPHPRPPAAVEMLTTAGAALRTASTTAVWRTPSERIVPAPRDFEIPKAAVAHPRTRHSRDAADGRLAME